MPFSPSAMSTRIGTSLHEPLAPVHGMQPGGGVSGALLGMLGMNKKPWTPGRGGGMARVGPSLHMPHAGPLNLNTSFNRTRI